MEDEFLERKAKFMKDMINCNITKYGYNLTDELLKDYKAQILREANECKVCEKLGGMKPEYIKELREIAGEQNPLSGLSDEEIKKNINYCGIAKLQLKIVMDTPRAKEAGEMEDFWRKQLSKQKESKEKK